MGEEVSDNRLMKEIDEFLNEVAARESLEDGEHQKMLLVMQDKAGLIHHPSAKKRRMGLIKVELQKLRKNMTLGKSVEKGGMKERLGDLESSETVEEEEAVVIRKKNNRPVKEEEKDKKKVVRPPKDDKEAIAKKKIVSKEEEEMDAAAKKKAGRPPKPASKKPDDKKRKRGTSDEETEPKEDLKKKRKVEGEEFGDEKT